MKFNKQIALILVLGSLLISAIGAALYLYKKNEETKRVNEATITVFVAKKNMKKNHLVQVKDIKSVVIAKKYLVGKPMLKKEIINNFTKIDMYKDEMFRKEKLSKEKTKEKAKNLPFKNSSYNIGFSMFKNPNFSLNKGDRIHIASVYPKSKDKKNMDYKVRYVAQNIQVLGFLIKGEVVDNTFRKIKQKVKPKKKKDKVTYELVTQYANEMILDIKQATLLSLLEDYNKGKQLWMVQVSKELPKKRVPEKTDMIKTAKNGDKKATKKSAKPVKRSYPHKLYVPKNKAITKTAVIEYIDTKIPAQSSSEVMRTNLKARCESTNQFLIGSSRKVYLRTKPSVRSKVLKQVYRNYLIPYTKQVNKDWFEVCDGSYVHKNEAVKISDKRAKDILHANKK